MTSELLQNLGLTFKKEGSQLLIDCPCCGKTMHCHVAPDTALYHCKRCSGSGNAYQLIKHFRPNMTPAAIMQTLERFGLNNGGDTGTRKPAKPKDLSWLKKKLGRATDEDIERLCKVKGVSEQALRKFGPFRDKTEPIMFLPGFRPGEKKACGFLRVHLDGELIEIKNGDKEKYPIIGQHGLFPIGDSEEVFFCEAWRDALSVIKHGFNATASTGGASTWRDEWLPVFIGKVVYIIMDMDSAGNGGPMTDESGKVRTLKGAAIRAAEAIHTVAKQVKIVKLPYKHQEKHGKDLYDYMSEHTKDDFLALIKNTPVYEPEQKDDNGGKLTENVLNTLSTDRPLCSFPWTDSGAAEMLAELYGDKLRYCYGWGKWLVYNGKYWDRKRGEAAARTLCKKTARALRKEALNEDDPKKREAIEKYARVLEQSHKITATLKEAQHTAPFESYPDDFDSDQWAFNVQNGTVDLRTGKLQPHTPADLITYCAPVNHDENAKCPLWEKTLLEIFKDNGMLVSYVQRCFGTCLTGDVREQILLVFYGIGRNGKNVVLDTFTGLMGDYACEAAPTLLTSRSGFDEHPTEIADLCGRRLVIACESQKGGKLKADTVKRLTGNARLKARFMKKDFFEFDRTFKIILCTNHRPEIPENTTAIWERLKVVPFNRVFTEAEQDKMLINKLKAECPGILNWAVRGCLEWQKKGLQEPDEVGEATWEYQESQNPLDDFFDQGCKFDAFSVTPVGILKERFAEWEEKIGRDLNLSTQTFNREMRKRGCKYETQYYEGLTQKVWCGIYLC